MNWTNGKTFTWTAGRQLSGVTDANNTIAYTYDDNGIRTSKTVNGTKTDYYLDGTAIIMQKTGDQCIWYTYDESGNLSGLRVGNSEYYYYRNGQGDIIGIIDGTGSIAAKYSYDAWGTPIAITDGAGNDVSGNVSHIANINPFRYRGYFYDVETGLYYLQSRYYDPQVGRFLNADGIIGANGYVLFNYCGNNPIMLSDPSGMLGYDGCAWLTLFVNKSRDYTYYNQNDNDSTFIDSTGAPYSESGCGPTAAAMVATNLTGEEYTPNEMGDMAKGMGMVSSATDANFFPKMAEEVGLLCTATNSVEDVKIALQTNSLVIAYMGKGAFTNGGHYIVLYAYDSVNNVFYVMDPNGKTRLPASVYRAEDRGTGFVYTNAEQIAQQTKGRKMGRYDFYIFQ